MVGITTYEESREVNERTKVLGAACLPPQVPAPQ